MTWIHSYNGAMRVLSSIENGKCSGPCRTSWMRNFKYALKTKSNPLKLTASQRKTMTARIKSLSGTTNPKRTIKKYSERKSPPYPANKNCEKKLKGNDGNLYESKPNKNGVCSWKKV